MSAKDRTRELHTVVQSLKQRQGVMATRHRNPETARRTEFMKIAKSIQSDINNTFTKLEKLTLCMFTKCV